MLRWLGRLYGAFFLVAGIAFLYWSARGLLAYLAGVRTAWSDPGAGLAGLAATALCFWISIRLLKSGVPARPFGSLGMSGALGAVMAEAERLRVTDPAAAQRVLDEYFMKEAAATEARRNKLREEATHSVQAAKALRKELLDDLKTNTIARRDFGTTVPEALKAGALEQVDASDRELRAEIDRLDQSIALKEGNKSQH